MQTSIYVLVDFDNLPENTVRAGPRYTAERIITLLEDATQRHGVDRIIFRFYGGWYGESTMTPAAQALAAAVDSEFPFVLRPTTERQLQPIVATGELAQSLTAHPKKTLHHTFRRKAKSRWLTCKHPNTVGCDDAQCRMMGVWTFFKHQRCEREDCTVDIEKLFGVKGEQKLVDTMMVADLINLTVEKERAVGIVTSDDDIWPGILTALHLGCEILHITTKYHDRPYLFMTESTPRYHHMRLPGEPQWI